VTTSSEPASLAQPRRQVQTQALWKRILKRPEAGALGGAILVFIFFWVIAPPFRQFAAFATVLYQAATIGIPAVAVALLMIGGEFDLSAGVAVTTSSLAASMFATQVADSLWAGVVVALFFSLGIGALNGLLLVHTRLHSFLVTLGTFLMLQGLNIAITKLITGNVATGDISGMAGFNTLQTIFASNAMIVRAQISITIVYWLIFVALSACMPPSTKPLTFNAISSRDRRCGSSWSVLVSRRSRSFTGPHCSDRREIPLPPRSEKRPQQVTRSVCPKPFE